MSIKIIREGSAAADVGLEELAKLRGMLMDGYEVQAELFELNLQLQNDLLNTQGALAEMYETVLGGGGP